MKLKTFNIANSKGHNDTTPRLSMNNSGLISFNGALAEKMKLRKGLKILFHQDEDRPQDWFIELTDLKNTEAFELRTVKNSQCLGLQSAFLVKEVRRSLEDTGKGSMRFLIGEEQNEKGLFLWPIITKSVVIKTGRS